MSNITRWNPVRDLISMRDAMDRMFNDRFFRNWESTGAVNVLPIDAYVTEDAVVLVADVPGLKPEDLSVTLEGDTLIIRGEIAPVTDNKNYLLRERWTGKFERTLTINTPIDRDKVEATFENGVLTLTMPKTEAVKPRQITVRANAGKGNHN